METKQKSRQIKLNTLRALGVALLLVGFSSCKKEVNSKKAIRHQMVSKLILKDVRLADGMPLTIHLSTRWEVADKAKFEKQFVSSGRYDSLVLHPKQLELANQVSNTYLHVDSVFTVQRQGFIIDLKKHLLKNLGENDIAVNDVVVSKIEFPSLYTEAKERLALQDQELKRIRKQSVIDLEQAEAKKKYAVAQGAVNVEQAHLDAKLEKIQADMEKSRRASMLAKAETNKQVAERRAEADARRQVLMARADAEQKQLYANVDVERVKKLNELEVQKQEDLALVEGMKQSKTEEIAFQANVKLAELFAKNQSYAGYLINKEMASNVQIAVVPTGKEMNTFSSLLSQTEMFK